MILPPAMLGMLGGGQLGRFFVIAARELGYRVMVLDPDPHSPAGSLADVHLIAPYDDTAALDRLAAECAAATTEFENVPASALGYLARSIPVRPGAGSVAVTQDRIAEKTFLRTHGFPCVPHVAIRSEADLAALPADFYPAVLKVSRLGYDGKGQQRVASAANAEAAFHDFGNEPSVLERFVSLDSELSVVLTRGADGKSACFPVVENRHRQGILDVSSAPARVAVRLGAEAETTALRLAERLDFVGTLAVEYFVSGGRLLVNEIAPRPHNSGHYTLDACVTDQFEQQVRALCGVPLGETRQYAAAVMVNLLGDLWFSGGASTSREPDWQKLLALPNLKLHLYGKHEARRGRKMGHYTVIDADPDRALAAARAARAALGIPD